jgi:AraC-like DNA-binding protein
LARIAVEGQRARRRTCGGPGQIDARPLANGYGWTVEDVIFLRTRLRAAATRLASETARILDVALDAGFGDVSNFNRAFRAEFGVSPREFRRPRSVC